MNKRGQMLSTNTIIIVILAVLVLIVVAIFFTGGFSTFVDKVGNIWRHTGQETSEIVLECQSLCSNFENSGLDIYKTKFCQKEFNLDVDEDKKVDQTVICPDLAQVSCPAIEAAGGCF
jgi:hypothetical protein